MGLGRLAVEQSHLEPLALGATVLEPELHVLRFQAGKLLSVRHAVQFFRVFQDQLLAERKRSWVLVFRTLLGLCLR